MKLIALLLLVILSATLMGRSAEWFVSTNGNGNGSIGSPWSLQTALINSALQPGDTVWLRSGTYFPVSTNAYLNGALGWWASVAGNSNNPVTYRSYSNEWATIDRRWLLTSYVRFRDLEFYDSLKGHNPTNGVGNGGNGPWVHFVQGGRPGCEWINCVIHDIHNGFTGGAQARGCIIWYVGWNEYEHVGYPAPANFSGNISGWHMALAVNGIVSNAGLPAGSGCNYNIIFGGGQTVTNEQWAEIENAGSTTMINSNYFYSYLTNNISRPSISVNMLDNMSANGNYFAGPYPMQMTISGTNISAQWNTAYQDSSASGLMFYLSTPSGRYTVNNNRYFCAPPNTAWFVYGGVYRTTFAQWQAVGLDANSTISNSVAPPDAVYVVPNQDQAKRCHIAIYNWTRKDNVTVNLSGVLGPGDSYKLYSAQNYNAGPIQSGTFGGSTITVPMTNLTSAPILYGTNMNFTSEIPTRPPPTSPEFGAFVVIGSSANSALAPANSLRVLSPP